MFTGTVLECYPSKTGKGYEGKIKSDLPNKLILPFYNEFESKEGVKVGDKVRYESKNVRVRHFPTGRAFNVQLLNDPL